MRADFWHAGCPRFFAKGGKPRAPVSGAKESGLLIQPHRARQSARQFKGDRSPSAPEYNGRSAETIKSGRKIIFRPSPKLRN
jgi:hypothetical protein